MARVAASGRDSAMTGLRKGKRIRRGPRSGGTGKMISPETPKSRACESGSQQKTDT